jgi:hypothetical protein
LVAAEGRAKSLGEIGGCRDLHERQKLEQYATSGNFFGIRKILFPDRDVFGLSESGGEGKMEEGDGRG